MVDNHSALSYNLSVIDELQKICNALFLNSCIKSFRYFRVFENGLYLNLSTNHEWLHERMLKIPHNGKSFHKPLCAAVDNKYSLFLWQDNFSDPIVSLLKEFNIFNGVTVYKRNGSSVEAWSFGATLEDVAAQNYYINNVDFLKKFITFFNNTAKILIDTADASKLAQFNEKIFIIDPSESPKKLNSLSSDSQNATKDLHHLSKRELECLQILSMGKTFKEVAKTMSVSPRTIESHINSIKNKLNSNSKSDLIKYYWENILHIDYLH